MSCTASRFAEAPGKHYVAYRCLEACACTACVRECVGVSVCDGEKNQAATLSRPNAQVKTTDECCCRLFPTELLLVFWKVRAFPFRSFVSFNNTGEIDTLPK